jgi:hypothetical protein
MDCIGRAEMKAAGNEGNSAPFFKKPFPKREPRLGKGYGFTGVAQHPLSPQRRKRSVSFSSKNHFSLKNLSTELQSSFIL